MSYNRAAARFGPMLLTGGSRSFARTPYALPRNVSAVAILLPRRGLATETTTSSGHDANHPPPGFNVNEAKKPLSKNEQKPTESKTSQEAAKLDDVAIPKNEATSHPKTKAAEAQSLSELAKEKAAEGKKESKEVAKKEDDKKLTLWQKVKKEVVHYWDGTKLLATEARISSKLALKMAAGYELTRREHRQLQRTVQDLGRLVPFSVFVIVPFAELLLPVALRLFPNLLPSTYEGQKSKDAKATSLRSTRKEVSNFLRETLGETGLPVTAATAQKEEFAEFFRKLRSTGETPTDEDVIKVCKQFKDDLTLDNLSRPQLVGICRYMNLHAVGPDPLLRYHIRYRMRQIKRDDRAISYEGVDSLSIPELQTACASRGLRTYGMSPGRLRDDLQMWLDLRLKYGVPSTLLVLSNAFAYTSGKETELHTQVDALRSVLSSIPEELFHEIELEVHNAEGAATNKQRLEVLKEQQELIEEENEQSQSDTHAAKALPKDDQDIDDKNEKEELPKTDAERELKEAEEESKKV
ncbi:LETM1-domain-containing protein [Aulographum hederae CBS 113979]|uniref:LETM1-domain-containing protein n=1 Tax=Aulographum hederae CBS 113979 TaxID=1176131 RepID=A0A6G1H961_9PEZI|nr:LETM1-domain-containing protein [Aulographum hederae CBS 113979]